MSLDPIASLLVLPPLNCLVAACVGAAMVRRRIGRVLLAGGLAGLVLLSLPVVSGSLLGALQRGIDLKVDPDHPPEAIVILAGNDSEFLLPDGHTGYTVGWLTLERVRAGATLARSTGLPILVTGGLVDPDEKGAPSLAALMAQSLQEDFGLATQWQERVSHNTWENATLSAPILKDSGVGTVYLVTHAWHMRRALMAFRHAGINAVPYPVTPTGWPPVTWSTLTPHVSSWWQSYYALHEWIGCLDYALRA
jgi:uncharacterized SAM-binding protein YcdF (DUF218 family)